MRRVRRRRRRRIERGTMALGALSMGSAAAVAAGELARVWRRGSAPLPAEADDVLDAAEEAARQTVEVAVEGYRRAGPRETALLNMLGSFTLASVIARGSTHAIRSRGRFGPFRDLIVGDRHIHHFVPGIGLAFLAGGVSIAARAPGADKWLAIPFGVGAALTLDESALLLRLDDVYWTEEGILSVQITLATASLVSAAAIATRMLRRGERRVLDVAGSD